MEWILLFLFLLPFADLIVSFLLETVLGALVDHLNDRADRADRAARYRGRRRRLSGRVRVVLILFCVAGAAWVFYSKRARPRLDPAALPLDAVDRAAKEALDRLAAPEAVGSSKKAVTEALRTAAERASKAATDPDH